MTTPRLFDDPAPGDPLAGLDAPARDALAALALGALARSRTWVTDALASPALRTPGSVAPSQELVRHSLARLQKAGIANEDERRPGFWTLPLNVYPRVYSALLARAPQAALQEALAHADAYVVASLGRQSHGRFPTLVAAIARVRLDALYGAGPGALAELLDRLPPGLHDIPALLDTALADCIDETLFDRLHPAMQADMLAGALDRLGATLQTGIGLGAAFVRERARALVEREDAPLVHGLRWSLALDRLLSDGADRRDAGWAASFGRLLGPAIDMPLEGGLIDALRGSHGQLALPAPARVSPTSVAGRQALAQAIGAAALATQGRWADAEPEFDTALAALRKLSGKRRGLVPPQVALANVLALLAQQTPTHLDKALKFCLAEGGKREPSLDHPLGAIALAIQMRLGAAPREIKPFLPFGSQWGYRAASRVVSPLDLNRWLMRAWLKEGSLAEGLPPAEADSAQQLKSAYESAGLDALAEQLGAALRVLGGEPAPSWFFVPAGLERWQVALAALRSLGEPASASAAAAGTPDSRIVWLIETGEHGAIRALVPHEQKRGARGWGALKEVPLSRLQRGAQTLTPADAGVVRALRQETFGRGLRLDLAQAMGALFEHPHVAFSDAPGQFIELVEAGPELEVLDEGERLRVRMQPALQVANDAAVARWAGSEAEQKELDALRLVSIWRDGPQRAKLVRLTASQKRVAQLLGPAGLDIPRQGAAQLQEVLTGLGSHFRIHADDAATAQAARELPPESRLRAELQPVGDGLQLRLVVAPFGDDYANVGPRLRPGRGRARVVATLRGESVGVTRDLALEQSHLETVLDACPMLTEPAPDAPCEWILDAADDSLALLERLQPLNAIAALDWPQGRPVRVSPGALDQLMLKVKTRENWLELDGKLKVDEELVVGLQQLITFATEGKSRFMPLGDGRFLALTQELRDRVADIAAVTEKQTARANNPDEVRAPAIAAPWLQAALEGARVEHDAAYAARLMALDDARRIVPALPSTLQAQLRPYQEEGFEWAMRLAAAGLGACLADDMGLGKTLQALAVLLARAANGPALVVVPTSLIGNWRSEALRFAPSLRVHVYAEQAKWRPSPTSTSDSPRGAGGLAPERPSAAAASYAFDGRASLIAEMGRHDVLLVSYPMLQIDGEAFAGKLWTTLVLDEAQAIKNAAAKRSQAVFALQATFRLAMSGTPIENRLGELWSVMRACNPGLLGTLARFNERFAGLIERQNDRGAQRTLKRLIAPFILRRTKAQVLADLPPRTELVLQVQGDDAEKAHYEALRRDALIAAEKSLSGDGAGQAHLNILAGLTRLRRAACDPRLVTPTLKRPGAKVTAFAELATELVANGHKALVFSQFVDFLSLLREPLDEAGIAYQYLDGSTPAAERTRRVEAFQNGEGDLFLISLKAGGFGLNLTVADYVVIADPWWNPAAEDQASGRAHRIGQQRPVTVYRLVNSGTLEEKILTLHQTKRELADSVLESDGEAVAAVPMARELLSLMRGDALPE